MMTFSRNSCSGYDSFKPAVHLPNTTLLYSGFGPAIKTGEVVMKRVLAQILLQLKTALACFGFNKISNCSLFISYFLDPAPKHWKLFSKKNRKKMETEDFKERSP